MLLNGLYMYLLYLFVVAQQTKYKHDTILTGSVMLYIISIHV